MSLEQIFWSPGVTLATIERQVILKAYRFYRGNATQTSIALGVSERTIRDKLKEYEADDARRADQRKVDDEKRADQLRRHRGLAQAQTGESLVGSNAGFHIQPAVEVAPKPTVSVPKPAEVQSVLPSKVAASDKGRRR